jgi:hypothetical protein
MEASPLTTVTPLGCAPGTTVPGISRQGMTSCEGFEIDIGSSTFLEVAAMGAVAFLLVWFVLLTIVATWDFLQRFR